jgi:D-glycero-D-manno-heptose 1,7-bisphosphate phosphatase
MTGRAALFLDRDGTVIEDTGYLSDPDQVRLLPGAVEGLSRLGRAGFALVLVSNQSGIGRGSITAIEAAAVHHRLLQDLDAGGVRFDGAYYCPHAPEAGCGCRKPSAALVLKAAGDLNIELAASFLAGDKITDLEAARRAGCRPVAFGSGYAVRPAWSLGAADWPALERLLAK